MDDEPLPDGWNSWWKDPAKLIANLVPAEHRDKGVTPTDQRAKRAMDALIQADKRAEMAAAAAALSAVESEATVAAAVATLGVGSSGKRHEPGLAARLGACVMGGDGRSDGRNGRH